MPKNWEVNFKRYGSFATVSHCRHNVDGCDYAVKKIAIGRYKEFDYGRSFVDAVFPDGRFVPESESESDTSESEFTPEQCSCLCIVQELCDGTLKEHLSNGTIKKLSVEERLIILQQITEGLKYLHSKNFVLNFATGDAGDVVMPGFYRPPASEVRDRHFDMYSLIRYFFYFKMPVSNFTCWRSVKPRHDHITSITSSKIQDLLFQEASLIKLMIFLLNIAHVCALFKTCAG
ncbi:hypothetical protein C1H46_010579 [Malus baccata]|uniref:Protein kinase domain-containing protein n=1 Tax=Malus baccata TaxID=106549 RepID=A0A540MYA6_MALBA|nr:hypothetical protein C1H46_010579 [Malus baccata]